MVCGRPQGRHFSGTSAERISCLAASRAETGIVIVSLAAVMIAVSLFFVVLTADAGIDLRFRVIGCFVIGAIAALGYWKISQWVNPRLARFG